MSTVERMAYDAVIEERDAARAACAQLRATNATLLARNAAERAAAEELRQQLAAAEALNAEAAGESELERRAWELFASAMAAEQCISPQQSFQFAANWMAYRDEFRRDGAT